MSAGLTVRQQRAIFSLLIALLAIFLGINQDKIRSAPQFLEQTQPGLYAVLEVNDGDTITVNMDGRKEVVRLIGVDTPEKNHPEKPVQCFAQAATEFTDSLINGQSVRLEADSIGDTRDRYQRLLRYVYLPEGKLVNQEIISQGYGFAYTVFPFEKEEEFVGSQEEAEKYRRGLWSGCSVSGGEVYQTNEAGP